MELKQTELRLDVYTLCLVSRLLRWSEILVPGQDTAVRRIPLVKLAAVAHTHTPVRITKTTHQHPGLLAAHPDSIELTLAQIRPRYGPDTAQICVSMRLYVALGRTRSAVGYYCWVCYRRGDTYVYTE